MRAAKDGPGPPQRIDQDQEIQRIAFDGIGFHGTRLPRLFATSWWLKAGDNASISAQAEGLG
jgi:hypothetical protein